MADTPWRKSSYSGSNNGACLEVRDDVPGTVPVRDSKNAEGPTLRVPAGAWSAFVRTLK